MDIQRIAIVSIPVADSDRALAFYRDVLGLEVVVDQEVAPGMRWVQLRAAQPGANFSLASWGDGSAAGTLRGVMVQVPDARAAADEVRAAGTTVAREDYGTPFGHFVELDDPDGNGIVLWEPAEGMEISSITGQGRATPTPVREVRATNAYISWKDSLDSLVFEKPNLFRWAIELKQPDVSQVRQVMPTWPCARERRLACAP